MNKIESAEGTLVAKEILAEICEIDRAISEAVIALRVEQSRLVSDAIHVHNVQRYKVAEARGLHSPDIGIHDFGAFETVADGDESWVNRSALIKRTQLSKSEIASKARAGVIRVGLRRGNAGSVRTVFKMAES